MWVPMANAERAVRNTDFVLWCAVHARPFNMARDAGFSLFMARMDVKYAVQTISPATVEKTLTEEVKKLRTTMIAKLRAAKAVFAPNGEPFCCVQLDLTTSQNRSFVTLSVTFMDEEWELWRLALATKVLSGKHTAADLERFIREVKSFYCS